MLQDAAENRDSNSSSSDCIDVWIRFEKVLPSILSVIDAAQDDTSGLPPCVPSNKGKRKKLLDTLISALSPDISGTAFGSAF